MLYWKEGMPGGVTKEAGESKTEEQYRQTDVQTDRQMCSVIIGLQTLAFTTKTSNLKAQDVDHNTCQNKNKEIVCHSL